jgi:hypothetical protein
VYGIARRGCSENLDSVGGGGIDAGEYADALRSVGLRTRRSTADWGEVERRLERSFQYPVESVNGREYLAPDIRDEFFGNAQVPIQRGGIRRY